MMLENATATATLPAADMERAKRWYEEKLGLKPIEDTPGGAVFEGAKGTLFAVYPTPNESRGGHTQLGFRVDDVAAVAAELRARGVVFEEYDSPGLKTVDGVADLPVGRAAWFKDSEGNTLGIVQFE
jgi:catechol 2,3-dioxygenase-like lactoylglutathione lyase family enzyme